MRFYFIDGRMEWHRVVHWDDEAMRPPPVWLLREFPPHELEIAAANDRIPHVIVRTFLLVHFGYPPGFIGPQRESEYREQAAVLR